MLRINAARLGLGLLLAMAACSESEGQQTGGREGLVGSGLAAADQTRPPARPPQAPDSAPPPAASTPALPSPAAAVDAAASPEGSPPASRRNEAHSDPVAAAGSELLDQTQASRWGIAGSLTADDLTIRMRTDVADRNGVVIGEAGFNLDVVHGFRGIPKCNLLAFEIAYRAGFVVPLVGRSVGWGFPSSEMIGNDARDNRIVGDWAEVRRRPQAAEVNLDRENGMGIMAAARSAIYGRPGHVAIVDWVEELSLTRQGDIRVITFMGWEANTREGARYGRVTFATTDAVPTSRFDHVYLLDLRAAEPGNEVALIGRGPRHPTHVLNLEEELAERRAQRLALEFSDGRAAFGGKLVTFLRLSAVAGCSLLRRVKPALADEQSRHLHEQTASLAQDMVHSSRHSPALATQERGRGDGGQDKIRPTPFATASSSCSKLATCSTATPHDEPLLAVFGTGLLVST